MRTSRPYLAIAAALSIAASGAAQAATMANGLSFNGLSFNGLSFNGIRILNGLSFNGIRIANGPSVAGLGSDAEGVVFDVSDVAAEGSVTLKDGRVFDLGQ